MRTMHENHDVLERIRRQVPPPERAFERLADRRRRKMRNRRVGTAVLALLVGTAGLGGAVLAFGGGQPDDLGPGVSEGPRLVAGPGEYYYSRTLRYYGDDLCDGCSSSGLLGPWTEELWFGPDGSGRAVFSENPPPDGSVGYVGIVDEDRTFGPGEVPLEDLSNLPTDPVELLDRLTVRSSPGGSSPNPIATTSPGRSQEATSLLRTLQDLFDGGEQFTPPLVRAAMFEVARGIDEVETLAQTTDPVGRTAVSLRWIVQYEGPPSVVEWFFDPETKQLMAETWTQEGEILQARIVTDAGIVSSTTEVPGPGDGFFPSAEAPPDFRG